MNRTIVLVCCLALSGCVAMKNNAAPPKIMNGSPEKLPPLPIVGVKEEPFLKPKAKYPQNVMKNIALEACKSAVVATLYVPASFQQDVSKTSVKITESKGTTIKIPFTAKTGDGQKTSQIAYCVTDSSADILMLNITHK